MPLRSSTGMNFPGGISPRSGCFQRTSDSAPTSLPEKMSHWGWAKKVNSSRSRASVTSISRRISSSR